MAFIPLNAAEIAVAEPTKQELFQKIKDNDDNLDSRLTSVEAATVFVPQIPFIVNGPGLIADGITPPWRFVVGQDIKGVRVVTNGNPGTSGSAVFDVEISTDDGSSWGTILTGTITASTTAYATVSGTLSGTPTVANTDLLRINMDSVRVGASGYSIFVEVEVS